MEQPDNVCGGCNSYFCPPYCCPTASVRAQHEQQSTLVKAGYVTVNTTGNSFAGEPRYGRDTSGWTLLIRVIKLDKVSEYEKYTSETLVTRSKT